MSSCPGRKTRSPERYARREKRRAKEQKEREERRKKERKEAERRKQREGFYRCDVNWGFLVDDLCSTKKKILTTIIDDNLDYYDEIRRITNMNGKPVNIAVCGLGNYPLSKPTCRDEKNLLKLHRKYCEKCPLPFKTETDKKQNKLDFKWQNL